jgi:pyruvate dehydrogenase E1 component alpha subunit
MDYESIGKEKLIQMYTTMLKIRKFEEAVGKLAAEGFVPGLVHLYIGEEAVAVGACANLRKDDYITSTHRGHGHCIAKGGDVKKMMAEILGKRTGYCKGKGGSMHICAPEIGVMGCSGIVGASILIATGLGLAIQLKQTDQVVVSFFGDGAANTGAFHEGINMAAIWKLPVIYVCENNLYAISTSVFRSTSVKNIAERAAAYGIPGVAVDGMDVVAVYEAVKKAVNKARGGGGPTLIECKTYRFRGHMEGDPKRGATYRSEAEITEWEKKCPINNFKAKLIENHILTETEAEEIEHKCTEEIQEAVKFAKDSPYPSPEDVLEDVFVSL